MRCWISSTATRPNWPRDRRAVRIMLDQNFPVPVGRALTGHSCDDAYTLGWAEMANGELLAQAEQAGYDLLLTADRPASRARGHLPAQPDSTAAPCRPDPIRHRSRHARQL